MAVTMVYIGSKLTCGQGGDIAGESKPQPTLGNRGCQTRRARAPCLRTLPGMNAFTIISTVLGLVMTGGDCAGAAGVRQGLVSR